ncbi:Ser/Thr phosphatase family protein [Candidatus Scalindua japonica]|uniref:Ser/Thr phosphatase family protein n=1 Tax=Candidatus Scalindua japonica TaxID=1284222 RepID=A0A286TYD4_9BACT|nr:SUMF1/EgtB/PvdO family nonheme iron enzyme [Candidatus Scalindua japonica]GAX60887.1 Ser/Thr phosphatase family protein [Candidatus Scalindua japonica]
MAIVNILHLSDLHFGIETSKKCSVTALSKRENTLDELIKVLKKTVGTEWRPDIVTISGDIGWSGREKDYIEARKWIEDELLEVLELSVDNLIVCAGNHDINRDETMGMEPPLTHEKADKWLLIENIKKFIEPFKDYNRFCGEFKIPELSISENKYHLIGQREIKGLRFVVLNSAWFCRGDDDRGNLWMGLPQLKVMNAALQLADPEQYDTELITISILHHPPGWLNDYETNSYDERINTFSYISERSHIILCGHVHGAIEEPDRKSNSAYFFKGGATYSGDDYRNNFSIYQVDTKTRSFKRCAFEYNPSRCKWKRDDGKSQSLLKPESRAAVAIADSPKADVLDDEISSYCQKADALHAHLPVAGFVNQLKVPIDIDEIYVPLRAMLNLSGKDEVFANADHAEKRMERDSVEIHLPDAFKEARERNKRKGIVVLGDPGSGKTTHLKRLLLACLREGPEKLNLPPDILPVFLPLRELKDLDKGLDVFIQQQLEGAHLDTKEGFGKRLLDRKNLLFLLDGLDEVADLEKREMVARWIIKSINSRPKCYFVVTCRFAGYSPTVHMNENFLEMYIRPFDNDEVGRFVHNWYKTVEQGLAIDPKQAGEIAREKAERLVERLKESDFRASKVFELTRNPLLLTNICLIHRHRDDLPYKRHKLYEECIAILLEHWRKPKKLKVGVTAQDGSRVLQPVALWLHGEEGRTKAKATELLPHIEPVLKAVGWPGGTAEDFLSTIRDDSGLLTGWDQEHYGFMHLGFQEYLVAREIRSRAFKDKGVLRDLASHFGESWWQEVTLIMLALEDPSLFEDFMEEVVKLPVFASNPSLVDMCLEDAAETSVQPFMDVLNEDPGKDEELWKRQAAALRVVKRLDESALEAVKTCLEKHPFAEINQRFKEYNREESVDSNVVSAKQGGYELIKIPGGSFMMGSPKTEKGRYDDEGPQHEVNVPEFYMGVAPVTNRQYGIFMEENTEVTEPEYWADRRFNQPEQPVVGVSWDDAKKYAEWAGLRLPTEAEWEYACRAGTTTRYYLGDEEGDLERAGWYTVNSSRQSHPVGEKAMNGFGLYDMHGNVWEWVEDDWHEDYNGAPDNGNAWVGKKVGSGRVIRGGSWRNVAQSCRSAFRGDYGPDGRNINLGLRLSRSVAPGS